MSEQQAAQQDEYFGRMTDPSGGAYVRGICGDEMEFYLVIENNIIVEAKYYTEGCEPTKACGRAAAVRAKGKGIFEALGINPKEIIDSETQLPMANRHCAILAVTALYRAIADYLLKP